jgi:NTP pyrophosphatase (non-canonical NTP hydrolase)
MAARTKTMTAEPPITLRDLQARLAAVLRGLAHPPLASGAALSEEVGEVAKHLLDHHGYGKPLDAGALGGELADVLVCLCEIATLHKIDLDASVRAKLADLAARAPGWRKDLGAALDAAWRNPAGPAATRPD